MNAYRQLVDHLSNLVRRPDSQLNRAQRSLRWCYDLARLMYRQLVADRAAQMSAALTFRTIFSILPMLVLAMVVFQAFQGVGEYQQQLTTSVMRFVLPENLLAAEAGTETRVHLEQQIMQILDQLSRVNFGAIGLVGMVVFIYGATALLATIEASFNTVYGVDRGRPWYLRLTFYYTVITLGPIILGAGQVLESRLLSMLGEGEWTNWLVGPLVVLSPLLTSWIVLMVLFMLLPRTQVMFRPALSGSFVAAGLWVISKELFGVYVTHTGITSLYGALGLVPLFLFWLYVTWLIVLLGLELTYALQTIRTRGNMAIERDTSESDLVGDPQWILPIMTRIAEAFEQGGVVTSQTLAEDLALPSLATDRLLQRLEQCDLVRQTSKPNTRDPGFILGMPPQKITVKLLLETAQRLSRSQGDTRHITHWNYLNQLNDAQFKYSGDATLDQILPSKGK